MATDAWSVNNPGTQAFNDLMVQAVKQCRAILDEVERVLATMPASAQTTALAPWSDLRTQWNAHYQNMNSKLGAASLAGQGAHEAVKWGDRQSYAIMS
jgi:hypothetical protein